MNRLPNLKQCSQFLDIFKMSLFIVTHLSTAIGLLGQQRIKVAECRSRTVKGTLALASSAYYRVDDF